MCDETSYSAAAHWRFSVAAQTGLPIDIVYIFCPQAVDPEAAKFDEMRYIKPSTFPEPTRSMLLGAKDGDMLPPSTTSGGVELYAVCGRRTIGANDAQRTKTQEDLQYQQLESLAQRHMRNLRQDAHIEYR